MRLVIVVGLLAVTVIALIVALTLQMAVFRREEYKTMCQSEECIKTGKAIYAFSLKGFFTHREILYFEENNNKVLPFLKNLRLIVLNRRKMSRRVVPVILTRAFILRLRSSKIIYLLYSQRREL